MIVYHGSNSRFETLRISKSLVKSDASALNEGMGIYFSTFKSVACSYGKYVYTLEINDDCLIDFRKKPIIRKYLKGIENEIYKTEKIYISRYVDLNSLVEYIYQGNIAISGICREIELLLDSNEYWYKCTPAQIERVYEILRKYDKKHQIGYLFNYNIMGIGILRKVGPEIVRIVKREKSEDVELELSKSERGSSRNQGRRG